MQPCARPPQLLPQHRGSVPSVAPVNTTAQVPSISQQRRPSAPAQLITGLHGFAQNPMSASPINNFSGLSLAGSNPPTPVTSRPPTAAGQFVFPQSAPPSRPASSRGGSHMHPPIPHRSSSSSLAGAVIDLTGDDGSEDSVRKKRKLGHYSPPVPGSSVLPSGPMNTSMPAASGSLNGIGGQVSPVQADTPRPEMPPTSHQHPAAVGSAVPLAAVAAEQQARVPPPAQLQPPPSAVPEPVQDVVMEEEAQQEEQTTVEEDCLEANFDEDEEDGTKQWCRMCRSVFACFRFSITSWQFFIYLRVDLVSKAVIPQRPPYRSSTPRNRSSSSIASRSILAGGRSSRPRWPRRGPRRMPKIKDRIGPC